MQLLNIGLGDSYLDHGSREECLAEAGLDSNSILRSIEERLQRLVAARRCVHSTNQSKRQVNSQANAAPRFWDGVPVI